MNTIYQGTSSRSLTQQQWTVVRASVRGKAHIDNGTPNQDAENVKISQDGTRVAAAVCDGAGTAPRAEEGAQHFAKRVCTRLYELGEKVSRKEVGASNRNQLTDEVFGLVQAVRTELDPDGSHLAEYHCTLVAILITPELRLFLKLGDSLLLKTRFAETTDDRVDFFVDLAMTQQERSDYANETHFVTQPEWRDHLVRDTIPLDSPDMMYALMTDGAGDIALQGQASAGQKRVYRGFFGNLLANILALPAHDRDSALYAALEHRGTHRLTGDDKTVVLLLRSDAFAFAGREPLLDEPATSAPVAVTVRSPAAPAAPNTPNPATGVHPPPASGSLGVAGRGAQPATAGPSAAVVAGTHASTGHASLARTQLPPASSAAGGMQPAWLWGRGALIVAGTLAVVALGTLAVKALDKFGTARTQPSDAKHSGSPPHAPQPMPTSDAASSKGAAASPSPAATDAAPTHVQPVSQPVGAPQVETAPAADSKGTPPATIAHTSRVILTVKQGGTVVHTVEFKIPNTADRVHPGTKREKFDVDDFGTITTSCTSAKSATAPNLAVTCKFSIRADAKAKVGKLDVALAEFSPLGPMHGDALVTVDVTSNTSAAAPTFEAKPSPKPAASQYQVKASDE